MEIKVLLLSVIIFLLKVLSGITEELVLNCMDSAYCALIKGDIAKESKKYNNDPKKYYTEAEEFFAKATEYNKTKDESILKVCQTSYTTCSEEASKMAVDGLSFPEEFRTTCSFEGYSRTFFECKNIKNWPVDVRKALPNDRLTCQQECLILDGNDYILSNGKHLVRIPNSVHINMTDLPTDLETRVRIPGDGFKYFEVDRIPDIWLESGLKNSKGTPTPINNRVTEVCPEGSWVDTTDNFLPNIEAGICAPLYVAFVCRTPKQLSTGRNQGYIISNYGLNNGSIGNPKIVHPVVSPDNKATTCSFSRDRLYENCNRYSGTNQHTFITGVSLTQQTFYGGATNVIHFINFLCGDSKVWKNHGTKVDSNQMLCPDGMAVCGLYTKVIDIPNPAKQNSGVLTRPILTGVSDVEIACCKINKTLITNLNPAPVVVPPTGTPGGIKEIYNLQQNYFLFWAGVLSHHITRYNYFYTPHTIDKETEWLDQDCADTTVMSGFELTNPVSNYFWTRRIMVLKMKCSAIDGTKPHDIDLYEKLNNGKYKLFDSDLFEKSDCSGGYYSSMEITYYLDKSRQALVHAWGINMKCNKGGNTEDHKHIVNSSQMNTITDNVPKTVVANCPAGEAIFGFNNTIIQNRKGTFEGLYYILNCREP